MNGFLDPSSSTGHRGRGSAFTEIRTNGGRPHSRNKIWTPDHSNGGIRSATPTSDSEQADHRGSSRGGARGRGASHRGTRGTFRNATLSRSPNPHPTQLPTVANSATGTTLGDNLGDRVMGYDVVIQDPALEGQEEREKFYKELLAARELERKQAIAEGKMDDPLVPKRLEDAISMVGTCLDMCPRFERWRRERENNLFEWEMIPGTKRIDHPRAVKMYERAAGDKTQPSDLRPPIVLKRTLDYLFRDLIPKGGFSRTCNFVRDRSRAVRTDFTMQHETGALAIECHDRCARFHLLTLHLEKGKPGFSAALEEQQFMNTLQSLKEFYEDQRGRYSSPTELEMRIYHRLIHIRDQRERHDDVPELIQNDPVYQLTTKFRLHVQERSAPIKKNSALVVDGEAMQIFGQLAETLRKAGSVVMIYLVACILEHLFGKDAIDDIEAIRGDIPIPDIIDGISVPVVEDAEGEVEEGEEEEGEESMHDDADMLDDFLADAPHEEDELDPEPVASASPFQWPAPSAPVTSVFGPPKPMGPVPTPGFAHASANPPARSSAFSNLTSKPNPFGTTPSPFGVSGFGVSTTSGSAFSKPTTSPTNPFAPPPSIPKTSLSGLSSSSINLSNPPPPTPLKDQAPVTAPTPAPALQASLFTTPPIPAPPTTTSSFTNPLTPSSSLLQPPKQATLNVNAPSFTSSFASTPTTLAPSAFKGPSVGLGIKPPLPSASTSSLNGVPTPSPRSESFTFTPSPSVSRNSSNGSIFPPSLKLDTKTATANIFNSMATSSSPSPLANPPLLPKPHPISLPSTPTITPRLAPAKSLLSFWKGTGSGEAPPLSPLIMPSSAGAQTSPVADDRILTPSLTSRPALSRVPTLILSASESSSTKSNSEVDALQREATALQFSKRSLLVRDCFDRWKRQVTDKAAYEAACRSSSAYRQKAQNERSLDGSSSKRQRMSTTSSPTRQSPQKRAKRRISSEYRVPLTDEAMVQRFKENHEENAQRWARGSFLETIKGCVKGKGKADPPNWTSWLCMNPENSATAIWLEHKFDVPKSGEWESEAVFSIPITSTGMEDASPGLIIFECTPLDGITDELERKFRILDDCARLRDVIKVLPAKRRYIPSLMVVLWQEGTNNELPPDLVDMISKFTNESTLESCSVFVVSHALQDPKDIEQNFMSTLGSLTLDLEGKLVKSLTVAGIFGLFDRAVDTFINDWLTICTSDDEFNWKLFAHVVDTSLYLFDSTARISTQLLDTEPTPSPWPPFPTGEVSDSESAYSSSITWLSHQSENHSTFDLQQDLQTYHDLGREFPGRDFLQQLNRLTVVKSQLCWDLEESTILVLPVAQLKTIVQEFEAELQPQNQRLRKAYTLSLRRSPKRRFASEESERTTAETKRARLSSSTSSMVSDTTTGTAPASPETNGRGSPSPAPSTTSITQVTIAMLRALTKNVKQQYKVPNGTRS